MRVLVVGGGGREHALCWAIGKSPLVGCVLCAPGNGGIAERNRRNVKESDFEGIVRLARNERIDLVVIGPEAPLVAGLAGVLEDNGIRAFGPSAEAAWLEGSKIYMKNFCRENAIPTAQWHAAYDLGQAYSLIAVWSHLDGAPPVVKADGLCGGKGVVVARSIKEAKNAARDMLVEKKFGTAGSGIVIESRLIGRECSMMWLCDGEHAIPLPPARDYKRAKDGDTGPNTGGMGAYSPLPDVDDALIAQVRERVIEPVLYGMGHYENAPFRGLLYAGLMLTAEGPSVLEFNVRFGDPETQTVLPRLQSDIVPYLLACTEPGGLAALGPLGVSPEAAVCNVLVSKGYPGRYETGYPIHVPDIPAPGTLLFHAGTRCSPELVTSGGRVMDIVGLGAAFDEARMRAAAAADSVSFANKFRRTDIASNV